MASVELERTVVGGSVDRRLAKARPPTTAKAMIAATPTTWRELGGEHGDQDRATMKIDSSTTASNEYAVCRLPLSLMACAHRARTQEPMGG
jgi:hypothetical protein